MKVFIGLYNIASLFTEFRMGFEALGHEVVTANFADKVVSICSQDGDFELPGHIPPVLHGDGSPMARRKRSLYSALWKERIWKDSLDADLFIFLWSSFRPDASDMRFLKSRGKKVVMGCMGSEVRYPPAAAQYRARLGAHHTDYIAPLTVRELEAKLNYLRTAEQYADVVLNGSELSLRPVLHTFMLDTTGIPSNAAQRRKPRLLHAPSRKSTKGSDEWAAAFETLKREGLEFDVKMVQNLPHDEMLRTYQEYDIYCGSLYYSGKADFEALAAGCVVLSSYWDHTEYTLDFQTELTASILRERGTPLPKSEIRRLKAATLAFSSEIGFPVVNVTPDTVTDRLRRLIVDYDRRCELAAMGPEFATTVLIARRELPKVAGDD